MLVEFGKASLIDKARSQPDKVKQVVEKAMSDGILATIEAVKSKLDQSVALGYCNVGRIAEIGNGIDDFRKGDRVVSNGQHAEWVRVPKNLVARIPDDVSDEEASFTVLAAIGLQGVRLAKPTLGEGFVVIGLGLIGLLTVQILRAHGCRVLGVDFDERRLALAKEFGAEVVNAGFEDKVRDVAERFSRGRGVDGVIITASTSSSEPVSQAARMSRKRGRIVLVGVTGMELSRADFYEKEISFQVSCSYGPGRYDSSYEEDGHDYPIGFVRWTEQRNFQAVLDLMARRQLNVAPLISHRYELDEVADAYNLLASPEDSLGIVLRYPELGGHSLLAEGGRTTRLKDHGGSRASADGSIAVGFLGSGNYASRVLIPAFKSSGAKLHTVVSSGGISSVQCGKKFGFLQASTDEASVFGEESIDAVVVSTRHNSHAGQVLQALKAGKHVYCEKPLCLTLDDLKLIENEASQVTGQLLMLGFNRRFAPQVVEIKSHIDTVSEPKSIVMTVNAGEIPADHWTQDSTIGGGRLVGEGCHFIDLLRHLVGSEIVSHRAYALGRYSSLTARDDKTTIVLEFADGSVGTVHYLANGHRAFPKERLEIFCAGRVLQLDNFRVLRGWGWKGFSRSTLWRQNKGVLQCVEAFTAAIQEGTPAPIPLAELFEVSRVSIELAESVR